MRSFCNVSILTLDPYAILPSMRIEGMLKQKLIIEIASRAYTAQELASEYETTTDELKAFVEQHRAAIEAVAAGKQLAPPESALSDVTPAQLDDLWITKKFERLKRLQAIAEETEKMIAAGGMNAAELAMAVREFRSYLMLAANELGQLLNRGAGDSGTGDTLSVEIAGVDMDNLR